jgi:hypothetical protein
MSDEPRTDESPAEPPPATHADGGKRRFLIRAAGIGVVVPVVMTIGKSAFATPGGSAGASAGASNVK